MSRGSRTSFLLLFHIYEISPLGLYYNFCDHMLNDNRLARVYTSMGADVKRIVLRLVEGPVRSLGMGSPQLLALVENCPKGSETLVTRIIHILTEKCMLCFIHIYVFIYLY